MKQTDHDKAAERARYDLRAGTIIDSGRIEQLGLDGAEGVPEGLRAPYLAYENHVRRHARPGISFLDVCCGNGLHSLTAARCGATVTVTDIAPRNVELTLVRAARAGFTLAGTAADAEQLPYPDGSFDVVTCAGSLSYVDLERFLDEITRILRPGGGFIFVDWLNHNPIYRLNRWRHYRRGERSLSTLRRMPTIGTLQRISRRFPDLQVSYHGLFSFLFPFLKLLGLERTPLDGRWLFPWLSRYAFKIVGICHKPGKRVDLLFFQ